MSHHTLSSQYNASNLRSTAVAPTFSIYIFIYIHPPSPTHPISPI
jgi:hypothetical protein